MEALKERIRKFLAVGYGYGNGYGDGSGDGYGYGYGYGNGYGYGYGNGSGDGSGDGYGDGSGDGYGYGYGYGNGSGDGYGDGYGDGDGYGNGYGSGYGYGYGDGYGYGNGLKSFGGSPVHYIDGVPTVITKVHGNLAKGFIINGDMTTQECYIAKGEDKFAHGETFAEAQKALQDKIFEDMDTEEKIEMFLEEFKPGVKYPAKSFYEWHHKLTGSCEFGRNAFVKDHKINIEAGMYTVEEFIEYTKNAYGGEIIQKIKEQL